MIREKIRKNILTTIDEHSRFENSDFNIETAKDSKNMLIILTIKYLSEPKYKISFKIPSSKTVDKEEYHPYYAFSGNVCPGPLSLEESFSFKGENEVYLRITEWLNCIWEELSSNPIIRQVENQQKQIEEIFEKFETIQDGYFTKDEVADLLERLDELEVTLKEQIEKSDKDKKDFDEKIEKLHADIDTLKQTAPSLTKKGWLKSFTNKVFKWTKDSDNRKMLKDGYLVIREFLPDEIKNGLPGGN